MDTTPDSLPNSLIERFVEIVGAKYALRAPDEISPFVHERRGLYTGRSALVLKPGSTEEVSRIMRLASETGTGVVPQGGNTGLVGGQTPDMGGRQVVLSLSRLDRIREIDLESNVAVVEAGVILQNLQEAAATKGRLFPLSLGSQGSCVIGGNLSSNAGGIGALVYGTARDLCLGVEVVLPTGEVFDDLRKLKKDNTGYDLKDLFVGGEGTLGIITAAVVKLFPMPKGREIAWAALASAEDALSFFLRASEKAGTALTAFELVGKRPLDFTMRHVPGVAKPFAELPEWAVMLEISSGRSAADAHELMEAALSDALEAGLIQDAVIAQNQAQAVAFHKMREDMSEAQKPEGASIKHDISVPVAKIPEFIRRAAEVVEQVVPGARVVCFGHMGDGNLHYNVTQPEGADPDEFLSHYRATNDAVHAIVRDLGGSFSAEHGIGVMKRDELAATAPAVGLDLMRRIKAAFDPAGIMNPGKVL